MNTVKHKSISVVQPPARRAALIIIIIFIFLFSSCPSFFAIHSTPPLIPLLDLQDAAIPAPKLGASGGPTARPGFFFPRRLTDRGVFGDTESHMDPAHPCSPPDLAKYTPVSCYLMHLRRPLLSFFVLFFFLLPRSSIIE